MTALAEQLVTLVALSYPLQFAYHFLRGLSGYSLILQFDSSPYPLIVLILIRLNWRLAVVVNVECGLWTPDSSNENVLRVFRWVLLFWIANRILYSRMVETWEWSSEVR